MPQQRWHCHLPALLALLLLGPHHAGGQQPSVRLLSVEPRRVFVDGGTAASNTVTIRGAGFGSASACAQCRLGPPPSGGSTVVQASGYGGPEDDNSVLTVNATVLDDGTARCTLPRVLVGGPIVLALSANGVEWAAPFWWTNVLELTYVERIDVAIGRRPYYGEAAGSLLVYTHESLSGSNLQLRARLPCAGRSWQWQHMPGVAGGGSAVAELAMDDFASLPPNVNAELIVDIVAAGAAVALNTTIARRFMRVPPLPASSAVEPMAVDHSIRGITVGRGGGGGGLPFVGTGWFMDGHRPLALRNLSAVTHEVERIAAAGVNQVMLYSLPLHSPASVRRFLDAMHVLGVKVWVDIQPLGFSGAGGDNYANDWADPAWQAAVRGNVSLVMDHPSILGWYLCDDCCPLNSNIGNVTLQAKLYNLVKSIDGYHLTTGAIQCNFNTWIFSDVPAGVDGHALPPPSSSTGKINSCMPALDEEPALQLSLDVLLVENCELDYVAPSYFNS